MSTNLSKEKGDKLIAQMESAAKKATKGDWVSFHGRGMTNSVHTKNDERCGDIVNWPGFDGRKNSKNNARHIAKASPQNTLYLIERVKAAEDSQIKKLPDLNQDLIDIMGRPNFQCIGIAGVLRDCGFDIKNKSEYEQAAVIHYLLGFYLEHGDKWKAIAESDLQSKVAAKTASNKNA